MLSQTTLFSNNVLIPLLVHLSGFSPHQINHVLFLPCNYQVLRPLSLSPQYINKIANKSIKKIKLLILTVKLILMKWLIVFLYYKFSVLLFFLHYKATDNDALQHFYFNTPVTTQCYQQYQIVLHALPIELNWMTDGGKIKKKYIRNTEKTWLQKKNTKTVNSIIILELKFSISLNYGERVETSSGEMRKILKQNTWEFSWNHDFIRLKMMPHTHL